MTDTLILVTGASRGLGYATAEALAAPGTHIIAVARTVGGLEELDDRIKAKGGSATLVPLDITDEGGLQRLGLAIHERWGHLDTFIHAAAHAVPLSPVEHVADKDMDRAHAVNARATQRLIAMMDPLLRASEAGRAVIVTHEPKASKFWSAYRASKLAQKVYAEAWAAETERMALSVQTFEPNPMATALRARFYPTEDREGLSSPAAEAERLIEYLS